MPGQTCVADSPPSATPHQLAREAQYRQVVHYTALGTLAICPLLIALPPRKLDTYTLALIACTGLAANHASRHYTGFSLVQRAGRQLRSIGGDDGVGDGLPGARAREVQELLRRERAARRGETDQAGVGMGRREITGPVPGPVVAAVAESRAGNGEAVRAMDGRLRTGWKAEREAKEKETLVDGKGYGDLIAQQMWEVWNWSGRTAADRKVDEAHEEAASDESKVETEQRMAKERSR
jgi:hypothetical protein